MRHVFITRACLVSIYKWLATALHCSVTLILKLLYAVPTGLQWIKPPQTYVRFVLVTLNIKRELQKRRNA